MLALNRRGQFSDMYCNFIQSIKPIECVLFLSLNKLSFPQMWVGIP